jgi:hypothetical protein
MILVLNKRLETDRAVYYFSDTSKPDFKKIERQERTFSDLLCSYSLGLSDKVSYYKLTDEESNKVFGMKVGGCCAARRGIIVSTYWFDPHETSHIIGKKLGSPPKFISEGFAVYNSWFYAPEKKFFWDELEGIGKSKKNITANLINKLLVNNEFLKQSDSLTYPVAGLFMKYVANALGKTRIKELFNIPNNIANLEYDYQLQKIISDFVESYSKND